MKRSWAVCISLIAVCGACQPARPPASQPTRVAVTPPSVPPAPTTPVAPPVVRDAIPVNPSPPDTADHAGRGPRGVNPPTGHACRVHLRRDALGLSGAAPLPVGQDSPVGRATLVTGTIDEVTEDWLVLRSDGRRLWIPRGVILVLELTEQP